MQNSEISSLRDCRKVLTARRWRVQRPASVLFWTALTASSAAIGDDYKPDWMKLEDMTGVKYGVDKNSINRNPSGITSVTVYTKIWGNPGDLRNFSTLVFACTEDGSETLSYQDS